MTIRVLFAAAIVLSPHLLTQDCQAAFINVDGGIQHGDSVRLANSQSRFSSVVRLDTGSNVGYSSAVMLTPTIGVTTASELHNNFDNVNVFWGRNGAKHSRTINMSRWEIHEDYQNGGTNLAMFQLPEAIPGLTPTKFLRRDRIEEGQLMTYVGYQREIMGHPEVPAGQLVSFKNRIDNILGSEFEIDRDEKNPFGGVNSTLGDAKVLRHEGSLQFREVGGGAFVKVTNKNGRDKWKLAGLGSRGGNGDSGFVHLAAFSDWILERSNDEWWSDYIGTEAVAIESNLVDILDHSELVKDAEGLDANLANIALAPSRRGPWILPEAERLSLGPVVFPEHSLQFTSSDALAVPEPSSVALVALVTICSATSFSRCSKTAS